MYSLQMRSLTRLRTTRLLSGALAAAAMVACSSGEKTAAGDGAAGSGGAAAEGATAARGQTIEIKMLTDEQGNNRFDPADVTAKPGDVLKFTLVQGVHNANFTADLNPGKSNLPPATELLQLPGQAAEIPLTFGEGTFKYQCDPHAALGMIAQVTVAK